MREWLKKLREEKGFSQQYVAKEINVTQQYYSLIENMERQQKIKIDILQKFSEIFDVSVEWIIEQENNLASVE